jgi:hypothetical protein
MANFALTELSEEAVSVNSVAHSLPKGRDRRREAVHHGRKNVTVL